MILEIKDLHVEIEGKEILKGVSLKLDLGKITAFMGPNGSGKSTLANVIMGNPKYKVTKGKIIFNNKDITKLDPDKRAKAGLFMSFQYPAEIAGITISNFLRTAIDAQRKKPIPIPEYMKLVQEKLKLLKMDKQFLKRYLNEGLSGGEKKRAEILQLLMLDPKLAILDETDSGLDIDALKAVAEGVNAFMNKDKAILIITHYKRILEHVKPDKLVILVNGKIAIEGSGELVDKLEEKGYGWIDED